LGEIAALNLDAFLTADTIPVAGQRVTLPDALTVTQQIKSTCYFLDAAQVGICRVTNGPDTNVAMFAVVVLVEYGREPDEGTLASRWMEGATPICRGLRAAEIAVVVAGYIRQLGYGARVHVDTRSDIDLGELACAAGVAARRGNALHAPFIGEGFVLAAVETSIPLVPDRPLASETLWSRARIAAVRSLGFGGTRSAGEDRARRKRPAHLSAYPMERIKRTPTPTTLILDDEVPRVPKRASFFNRAAHGDLGDKAKRERGRFALKHPLAFAMAPLMGDLVSRQDGPVAPTSDSHDADPELNARALKSLAHCLGADMAGICAAVPYAWYSHDGEGQPIPVRHRYAVVLLFDQGHDTSEGSSGDDWISGVQSMRAYLRGAEITVLMATHLRSLGYPARAHTNRDSEVLQLPLTLHAGLGELSRIGEVVLNPFVGPRFKTAVVTTDMPLAVDAPIDFGLQDTCNACRKCARECPCNAISHKDKVVFNGYEIWKPDVERCTRYRVTNPKGSSCGRCMKVCPFSNQGLLTHRLLLWLVVHVPASRRWIVRLDDWVRHGARNPVKKWWGDLTRTVDGTVENARGTNNRDLRLDDRSKTPKAQEIAYYPAATMPPPGERDSVPIDRKDAVKRQHSMETPESARARRSGSPGR
jgi:reductive dehalogenase